MIEKIILIFIVLLMIIIGHNMDDDKINNEL